MGTVVNFRFQFASLKSLNCEMKYGKHYSEISHRDHDQSNIRWVSFAEEIATRQPVDIESQL